MGDNTVSGKNFDHRTVWIEGYLQQFAAAFGIDLAQLFAFLRLLGQQQDECCR